MTTATPRFMLTATALAAALALSACGRDERIPTPETDTTSSTTRSDSTGSATPTPSTTTAGAGTAADAGTPGGMVATNPPGAIGSPATGPLAQADQQFLTKAAEGGQFEVEVAKLAAEKATDPAVKTFAQMLVDDHSAANDKLRQIASSHNLALPAAMPDEKKRELDRLAKLSGAEFDRQFVKMAGIKDHHHDIQEFEKVSQNAQSEDVKNFAQSTLPTLKKHLEAAEKLPGGKAKG